MTIANTATTNNHNNGYYLLISTIKDFTFKLFLYLDMEHITRQNAKGIKETQHQQIRCVCGGGVWVCVCVYFQFLSPVPWLLSPETTTVISLLGILPG